MGIISINEKRTSSLPHNTTGKEVSYRAGEKFPENLQDPTLTFRLGMYAAVNSNMGGFGCFWQETGLGTLYALDMQCDIASTVDYQANRIHNSDSSNYGSVTCDLTGLSNGRAVFFAHKASDFRSDIQIDDVKINTRNGTEVDLDPSQSYANMNGQWERSTTAQSMGSNATARSNYSSASFENVHATLVTSGKWNWINGATGSGETGLDNAADNNNTTKYLYFEASSGGSASNNKGTYLRFKDYYNIITGATI